MAKTIMIQGTGSGVGKSIIVTALCRIFHQDGYRVAPFKSQNMSLNSGVTDDGKEIARAQITQAEAAGIKPAVEMNPILLKPTSDTGAQVIVCGKPIGNMHAVEYHAYKPYLTEKIKECFVKLKNMYEIIVIEGAGSPAEINLQDNDIVNMYVARLTNAPVILITDIDKGGAFAWIVGTLELLPYEDRKRIKGIIINKFRGDKKLLTSAIRYLEDRYGIPVVGILPYVHDICISEEDSMGLEKNTMYSEDVQDKLEIIIVQLPHISNFTDFELLGKEHDVCLRYVHTHSHIKNTPDALIIPGTKNTIEDMKYLHDTGYTDKILSIINNNSTLVLGICGGFQMLGKEILDTGHVESEINRIEGLGVLDMYTVFCPQKVTVKVKAKVCHEIFNNKDMEIEGYEIHMGKSVFRKKMEPLFNIISPEIRYDGVVDHNNNIIGTYIHGIFDNHGFRRDFLNYLRKRKGLTPCSDTYNISPDIEYDKLADTVRRHVDISAIYDICGLS